MAERMGQLLEADGAALARIAHIGFLTLPNYSMIAFANALEAARMANYVLGQEAYSWTVATLDGQPVQASNGLEVVTRASLSDLNSVDLLFVCGGIDIRHAVSRKLKDGLRRLARRGVALGALCTGTFALAEAQLLDGYRCAIHWENLAAIREEFTGVDFVEDVFVIDRDRFTCTGGIAPLDLMLALVTARFGRHTATQVSEQFIVDRVRASGERQTGADGGEGRHPVLARAAAMMKGNIESPLAVSAVADIIGISSRQLERLFRRHLDMRPAEYYLSLRMSRARELLRLSTLSVTDVGMACGFQSPAHFSTTYRKHFGHPPRAERV